MKAWTDEECDNLLARFPGGGAYRDRALIRAAVEYARREEREACAEFIKTHHVVSSNVEPFHWIEKDDPRSHIGPDINQRTLAAAILVRGDKEPRDAERRGNDER